MYVFRMGKQERHKTCQLVWQVLLSMLLILAGGVALADESIPAAPCVIIAARAVSVEGITEYRRSGESRWRRVELGTVFCPGDWVSVRAHSRVALRFSNDSMLRFDQKTSVIITAPAKTESATLLELLEGKLHIITRTPRPFRIKTPIINAGVEGTEFLIDSDLDQVRIVVYEGKVSASNAHGSVLLADQESAITLRDQAPRKAEMVRPVDAVQWALYYPAVIDHRLDRGIFSESATLIWQQVLDYYRQGQLQSALELLGEMDSSERTAGLLTFRAGLLLSVGRVMEARDSIDAAQRLESGNSNAYALQAIIAVVQNDKGAALALANQAVEHDPASPVAKLALSYVQQAHFDIEAALASVETAVSLDEQSALAWSRLAELRMADGDLDRALEAAQQAVRLDPRLGRTQAMLGFAHLLRIDMQQAKAAFNQAIIFDQADPLPRLGLGLALVREGKLEAGRIEIEIAASLDPANSLIRSYLGKAYFEEKRYGLAGTQFDLARLRDPLDPTPWLYDAIQKQTQNRPIEALHDIQQSIELNNNRAVYRSKLLLDQDQAARGSSLARIYDNLGFEKRALMETAKSLSFDPSSHSAHRFLSDAYANIPRHEIARTSELLQAQLLQPINVNPVQPRMAVADLNIITGTGLSAPGFNEFAPLMERNKPQLVASGMLGSNGTLGDEVVASALFDRASISVGQLHYQTKGFRPNNDQTHNVYNAFMQYAVTPKFNVQAEFRRRESEHGDLPQDFDPRIFNPNSHREINEYVARAGARYALSQNQDLLFSGRYLDRSEKPSRNADFTRLYGFQTEAQHLFRSKHFNSVLGGGVYRLDNDVYRNNVYMYSNFLLLKNLTATLGLSHDDSRIVFNEDVKKQTSKLNPKIGVQWDILENLRLRFAWFEMTKPHLIAQQTLEPTQIAGFNQFFDDLNGSESRRVGIGLDSRLAKQFYTGMEISERAIHVPQFERMLSSEIVEFEKQKEQVLRGYLYHTPHPYWAFRSEIQFERFTRNDVKNQIKLDKQDPVAIETLSVPLSAEYFHPTGVFARFTSTFVSQDLKRKADSKNAGFDSFFLLDLHAGFRLPRRRGILSFEIKNLLDEKFFFRSWNFYQSEFTAPRFLPERTFLLRATFNF